METTAFDISALLKRLEILKNTIAIQDSDDINYQIGKLKLFLDSNSSNDFVELNEIIDCVNSSEFGTAMQLISSFLSRYQSVTKWTDPEVQGLQVEIRSLSGKIGYLEAYLSDTEKTIHTFEFRHTEELGALILGILSFKRQIAKKKAKENPNDHKAQEQFSEAESEEKDYSNAVDESKKKKIQKLTAEQEHELKTKFRQITKLTHPDLVDKKFEKQASELFIKAKQAKDNNDLVTINEILNHLLTGTPFTLKENTLGEKEVLRAEVKQLRYKIEQLTQQIAALKNSEAYQRISGIADWDKYFWETKSALTQEYNKLKKLCHE